ncbi:hypothetical protein [Cribrihabitans neustonicus]|uniref:hypothetical protein n=1 Tax=Cribrihabitans neustonicus TaxID=1429085 RepID=UPI003B59166F
MRGAAEAATLRLDYDRDFGSLVLGGMVALTQDGPLARALEAEETRQLRARAGYDFGPALGYVTLGRVEADTRAGRSSGPVLGLGMRVSLNRALQLTGELLHHQAGPSSGSSASQGETLSLGAAFRF